MKAEVEVIIIIIIIIILIDNKNSYIDKNNKNNEFTMMNTK